MPYAVATSFRYCQSPEVVQRALAGETVLVPAGGAGADRQRLYCLNETARAVWEALDQPRTIAEIVTILQEAFDGDPETLTRDVRRLLEGLTERAVVERQHAI